MKVRLLVAYQGTAYHGWQVQPDDPSVQGTLEQSYSKMTGLQARFSAAGRTDAGVHAAGQVVCFENQSRHDPHTLHKGLNALLPDDIVILECEQASDDFDPRRLAVGKHYRYRIHNSRIRPVFDRDFVWQVKANLDPEAMQQASRWLVGEHDFSSFRSAGCEAKSPVRRIDRIGMTARGEALTLDFFGSGFLKQMVRNIVGTLAEVGRAFVQPAEIKEILSARDRARAKKCAPARGLCLMRVYYDPAEYQLILDNPNEFP